MSDFFATYQKVQKIGNLPNVAQEKIEEHIPMAKIDVVDVISEDTYTAILEGASDSFTQEDFDKVELAEVYLTLKYLLPALNIESTGSGVTKATGFGDSRKENLSEFDLDKIIGRYQDNAMKILKRYAKTVDVDEDGKQDVVKVQGISMACISQEC